MTLDNFWIQLISAFFVFGLFKIGMGVLNKIYAKENKNPYGQKRTIHFSIFSGRAAEDTFVLALLMSMSGVFESIPVQFINNNLSTNIFILAFGYYALNMIIRYLVNYFNVKNGKPDILANYWLPDQQK